MNEVYLTIGSCWKNEAFESKIGDYGWDFVRYHRSIGVERFIVYDREATKVKELFAGQPDVIVKHFPECAANIHSTAWKGLIHDCQTEHPTQWLALIDADQALVPAQKDDMREVLQAYEQYAALQLNWHTFGSSGQETKQAGSLYERFVMRAKASEEINTHTQTICQPKRTLAEQTLDPHHVRLPANEISVNTNKQRVIGPFNKPALHDIAWIAHFILKSKQEWAIKNGKGRADIHNAHMPYSQFDEYEKFANAEVESRVLSLWNKAVGSSSQ